MIHYHGLPIAPETAAAKVLAGGHGFVSFRTRPQLATAVSLCQSFAVDNGAFSAWRAGEPVACWAAYYKWAADMHRIPNCDFAVIPDVIDGSEADNDALLHEWPLPNWFGAPVWHMHESLARLERLGADYPRICLGSSGEFSTVGSAGWWERMGAAMETVCDRDGRPLVKMHGLRMLNPRVFSRLPLASADSTNIGRTIGLDKAWRGTYQPSTKEGRAWVMRERIESHVAAQVWHASNLSTC